MNGFDLWLTTQPTSDDAPEPSQRHLDAARDELRTEGMRAGEEEFCATADEVYALACMLAVEEARASQDEADEHAAESWRDDMEDRYGDGPL